MPATLEDPKEYQRIFHWAETQKDGTIPSFGQRKNDPYQVGFTEVKGYSVGLTLAAVSIWIQQQVSAGFFNDIPAGSDPRSFASEAVPGTIPQGQNSPRNVRFGLYAEQMTASAFVAPRHLNKKAWLYRARPSVAHQGFVSRRKDCHAGLF